METKQIISWLYDKAARAHDHSYARMLNMTAKRLRELDAAVGDKKTPTTNGDRIREMSDEELSDFLCGIAYAGSEKWSAPFMREFCDKCPTVECVVTETGQKMNFYECDFKDGKCPHGSDILWWLKQPVEEAHE
jgi:hypothetical protein